MQQEINWGSVADWASAAASFLASVTALYLAREAVRVRLNGYVGIRSVIGGGGPEHEVVMLNVTNVGTRPTKITTIAISTGWWRWKRNAVIFNWEGPYSDPLPKLLQDGEEGRWALVLDEEGTWLEDLGANFARTWYGVESLKFLVLASTGSVQLTPEKEMRDRMHAALRAKIPPSAQV